LEGLGYEVLGGGPQRVIVMNDWVSDTSSWQPVRPYLDAQRQSWALVDLRGYGRYRDLVGSYSQEEAAQDVLAVADRLGWREFVAVGHSVSTIIALHLAQHATERVQRVVLVTPVPPRGMGVDDATLAALEGMGRGNVGQRLQGLKGTFGDRLSDGWLRQKAQRWVESADPNASAGYARLFARLGLSNPELRVRQPVLAITGEQDMPPVRKDAITPALAAICSQLTVAPIADASHYPMQETPPLFATLLERFLL
jgi:pimeloyl-ACP methyl ester carboxylesterase